MAPAQRVFGQHFLCLSLDAGGVERVAAALRTAFPLVFSRRVPPGLRGTLPQVGCELCIDSPSRLLPTRRSVMVVQHQPTLHASCGQKSSRRSSSQ